MKKLTDVAEIISKLISADKVEIKVTCIETVTDDETKPLKERVDSFEVAILTRELGRCKTQKEVAKALGLIEATLSEKLKKYGMAGYKKS